MIDWPNRRAVLGGLLTIFPACCSRVLAQSGEHSGCWVESSSNSDLGGAIGDVPVFKSGEEGLESALVLTLDKLSSEFGILPGFAYFQEKGGPNAKATSVDLLKGRPDGTVLLGLKLLRELLALPERDAAVVAVCAHEFAHIVSYSNGYISRLTPTPQSSPFRAEQFADYMAGYYAGRRRIERPDFPSAVFATTTSMYGGTTHGSATKRSDAVQEGFMSAFYRKLEPQAAIRRALDFAMAQQI